MASFRIYYRTEFPLAFALAVQEAGIRLRHIEPHRPEQNGKVERVIASTEEEFWSRATFDGFTSASQAPAPGSISTTTTDSLWPYRA